MLMGYKIKEVDSYAESIEQLGTKEKFWFQLGEENRKWLFKFSRENTGEHWSEKISEQICLLLEIPHVEYELAQCNGRLGVVTPNIIPEMCRMVMGNEVLHNHDPRDYPRPCSNGERVVRVREHTVSRVLGCLDKSEVLPPESDFCLDDLNAGDVFCGYLMLDVLVSNQDRHHENWAIVINNSDRSKFLCPTYDHAASLGRELLDSERKERLVTKDKNRSIGKFVTKAKSELFKFKGDKKRLSTLDAFMLAVERRERAKRFWLSKLEGVGDDRFMDIVNRVPSSIMTDVSKEFALKMIIENKRRLLRDE